MVLFDYRCPTCSTTQERLEDRPAPSHVPCACGGLMQRQFPAPRVHMPFVTVERGTSSERPPHILDTRPLAEGMTAAEWKQQRERKRYDRITREVERDVGDPRERIYSR